jgi:hypothetical protein
MMRAAWVLAAIVTSVIGFSTSVQAQDPALPEGPGKAQISTACTVCHAITQVTSQRRTKAEWADTVDQMIARGAQVSDADYKIIVDYLGKNFAPETAPAAGAPSVPKAK